MCYFILIFINKKSKNMFKSLILLTLSLFLINKSFSLENTNNYNKNSGNNYAEEEVIPDNINLDNLLLMELKDGVVVIELYPDKAPWHVYRVKLLTANGLYDGLTFHRVIKNFMVQTGDPTGTGMGGSQYGPLRSEFNDLKHIRGIVSMARSSDVNSANSQFFIVTAKKAPHLDNQYTIFGKVIKGMDLIDNIKVGDNANNGMVKDPDKIIKMKLVQDMNFNYQDDSEERIAIRKKQRIAILQSLSELKELNDNSNAENNENVSLIDRIFKLNSDLD